MDDPRKLARLAVLKRMRAQERPEFQETIKQDALSKGLPEEESYFQMMPRGNRPLLEAQIAEELAKAEQKKAFDAKLAQEQANVEQYLSGPDAQERYGMNPSDQDLAEANARAAARRAAQPEPLVTPEEEEQASKAWSPIASESQAKRYLKLQKAFQNRKQ